jgi:phage gp16-like protein
MSAAPNRRPMLAKIHIAKKELGLDDDTYRSVLMRVTGKTSSAKMSFAQMDEVLAEFKALGWKPTRRKPAANKYQRKIYALWKDGYKMGDFHSPTPHGFVRRMTGKDRADFLSVDEAIKVIEAIKAIMERAERAIVTPDRTK